MSSVDAVGALAREIGNMHTGPARMTRRRAFLPLTFDLAYLDRHAAFCNLIPGRRPARCASRTSMLKLNRLIFPFLISDTRA